MEPHKSPSFPPSSSPGLRWGSPALRPAATFPPSPMNRMSSNSNVHTPPHRPPMSNSTSMGGYGGRPGMASGSPRFGQGSYNPNSFRTPQPQQRHHSPSGPRAPWTDNRSMHRKPRFQMNQSPHGSPSVNPGGSDDITQYYHPSMVQDPWRDVPPKPVNFWLNG